MRYYIPITMWHGNSYKVSTATLVEIGSWCKSYGVKIIPVDVVVDSPQPDIQYTGSAWGLEFDDPATETLFLLSYPNCICFEDEFTRIVPINSADVTDYHWK